MGAKYQPQCPHGREMGLVGHTGEDRMAKETGRVM